jgi:hypothetical protein
MLLVRAPGRMRWLDGIAEAIAEVETAAGVRPPAPWVATTTGASPAVLGTEAPLTGAEGGILVRLRAAGPRIGRVAGARPPRRSAGLAGMRAKVGQRLLVGPALPGLAPVMRADVRGHLEAAGARGLPAPLRRWRPAAGQVEPSWRSSAGAVLTCEGPDGVSAQAVVALSGLGNAGAITPPLGGALVLRAWRARRSWGVACGLVLGASTALGLGREAGRVAAKARAEGWGALVLSGATALRLARAGSPDLPAPEAAAQAATGAQVEALFDACLAAGGLLRQPAGPEWGLAVTP